MTTATQQGPPETVLFCHSKALPLLGPPLSLRGTRVMVLTRSLQQALINCLCLFSSDGLCYCHTCHLWVCSFAVSGHNKISQPWWFRPQKFIFSLFWRLRIKVLADVGLTHGLADGSLLAVLTWSFLRVLASLGSLCVIKSPLFTRIPSH